MNIQIFFAHLGQQHHGLLQTTQHIIRSEWPSILLLVLATVYANLLVFYKFIPVKNNRRTTTK